MSASSSNPDAARFGYDDAGFTLVEAIISMVIFVTVLSTMTTVIAGMTKSMRQAEGVSSATTQARLAFQRLDKQVRYADGIRPLHDGGWSITFRLNDKDGPGNSRRDVCYQWRLVAATDELQTRKWLETGGGNGSPPAWATVAVGVVNTTPPFGTVTAVKHQGITVDLLTLRSEKPRGTAQLNSTFFARNTDPLSDTDVCS